MKETIDTKETEKTPENPVTLILSGSPPDNFSSIHTAIANKIESTPAISPDSVLAKTVNKSQNLAQLLINEGIQPESPGIMKGNDGGILLFHTTPDLAQLETLIKNNALSQKPHTNNLTDRTFGAGLALHTDIGTIQQLFNNGQLTQDNVLIIETQGMHKDYEVTVKQAYFDRLIKIAQHQIQQDPNLTAGFNKICDPDKYPEVNIRLEKLTQQNTAFNISALVIDTYNKLHRKVNRLIYRQNIQNNFEDKLPFGYRNPTDPSFLNSEKLLRSVDYMSSEFLHLPTREAETTRATIAKILSTIKEEPDDYLNMRSIKWDGNRASVTYREDLILNNLLIATDIKKLFTNTNDVDIQKLLTLLDGWYPMEEKESQSVFKRKEGIGTDLGSNTVAILRQYNPALHKVLSPAEKTALLQLKS